MRKLLLFVGLALVAVPNGWSAPLCGSGTLNGYVALGSEGCLVDNTLFSRFQLLEPITGATALSPGSVTVNPTAMGLRFGVGTTAGAGQLLQVLFGYQVSGPPLVGSMLSISGSATTGDGAVTVIEDQCAGGAFDPTGPTGCTGTARNLLVFDVAGISQSADRATFSTSSIAVITDITLDGGFAGSATLGSATSEFQAIPEPASYWLIGSGVCGLALFRRWSARKAQRPSLG